MTNCGNGAIGLSLIVLTLAGCGQQQMTSTEPSSPAVNSAQYLLADEPSGAEDVVKVREVAKDGDDIVIIGRIGGSVNPWIEGRAAFSIVDRSLRACSDIPGDTCPQPWDYCCETDKLPKATALVKIVDDHGNLLNTDTRELLKVKELATVVIRGSAKRDDAGNLIVLANGVYVSR